MYHIIAKIPQAHQMGMVQYLELDIDSRDDLVTQYAIPYLTRGELTIGGENLPYNPLTEIEVFESLLSIENILRIAQSLSTDARHPVADDEVLRSGIYSKEVSSEILQSARERLGIS